MGGLRPNVARAEWNGMKPPFASMLAMRRVQDGLNLR